MCGELPEVVRNRVRKDDPCATRLAGPMLGSAARGFFRTAHLLESRERGCQTRPRGWVECRHVQLSQPFRRRAGVSRQASRCPSPNVSSAMIGNPETFRIASILLKFVELTECLNHEQIRASTFEDDPSLETAAAARVSQPPQQCRAHRGEAPPQLTRLAGKLPTGRVDHLEPILEKVRSEPTTVRPNVFAWINSAPALMKPAWSETTASGARRFASSGAQEGTAADAEWRPEARPCHRPRRIVGPSRDDASETDSTPESL